MIFKCAGLSSGTVNGIGMALEIWFQGCKKHCKGCQNEMLQDPNRGYNINTDLILHHLAEHPNFYNSVVMIGGEPYDQQDALKELVSKVVLTKILYTGYLFEELSSDITQYLDYIVDGAYMEELATDGFPASSNQRIFKKGESGEFSEVTSEEFKNFTVCEAT